MDLDLGSEAFYYNEKPENKKAYCHVLKGRFLVLHICTLNGNFDIIFFKYVYLFNQVLPLSQILFSYFENYVS